MTPTLDETIILRHDVKCRHRARIELLVVRALITSLLAAGYDVSADDGESDEVDGIPDKLITAIFAVDEAWIRTRKSGEKTSFVYLVFGNDGWDVISDYGVNLEPIMAPLNQWIDEQESLGI